MKGYILSFRRGAVQDERTVILEIESVDSYKRAASLIGRKVVWRHPGKGFEVRGKILRLHGRRGRVLVRFRRRLPGQAVGTQVHIL